jgi:uncharacterized RDD family membrane protein YckC
LTAFLSRLAAVLIDFVVTLISSMALIVILAPPLIGYRGGATTPAQDDAGARRTNLILWGTFSLYSAAMLAYCGQTLGRMALRLHVSRSDGRPFGFFRALARESLGRYLSLIPLGLGLLWLLWDKRQQTWHDKLFDTVFRRGVPPERPS